MVDVLCHSTRTRMNNRPLNQSVIYACRARNKNPAGKIVRTFELSKVWLETMNGSKFQSYESWQQHHKKLRIMAAAP